MKRVGHSEKMRIKRLLDKRGIEGVTQGDFETLPAADGVDKKIRQIARRIRTLREEGYAITTLKRNNVTTYVWTKFLSPVTAGEVVDAGALDDTPARQAPASTSPPEPSLFELPPAAPQCAIDDDIGEAA